MMTRIKCNQCKEPMIKSKSDIYYEKYFPNGTGGGESSEYHELNIRLKSDVTKDDLLNAGFVMGKDEDDYECDFYLDEDGSPFLYSLDIPINGDGYVEEEELPDGMKPLPEDWEEGVPELIGLKPEWVLQVTMDG